MNFLIKDIIFKIIFWIMVILSSFKLFNLDLLLINMPYFSSLFCSSLWVFFKENTHWFFVGWFVLMVISYRGIPKIQKLLNVIRPKNS